MSTVSLPSQPWEWRGEGSFSDFSENAAIKVMPKNEAGSNLLYLTPFARTVPSTAYIFFQRKRLEMHNLEYTSLKAFQKFTTILHDLNNVN